MKKRKGRTHLWILRLLVLLRFGKPFSLPESESELCSANDSSNSDASSICTDADATATAKWLVEHAAAAITGGRANGV